MNTAYRMLAGMVVSTWILMADPGGQGAVANERPVADAGSSRYAAAGPVRLDGSHSYDPDGPGVLSFAWRQLSGPSVTVAGADTAAPLISGPFVQTDAVQECEFELVVSDGELTSAPDVVKIIIVPAFGATILRLENPPFRQDRPTIIFFGGGNGESGLAAGPLYLIAPLWPEWRKLANWIDFPGGYGPDTSGPDPWRTYYHYGDMIIAYLSSVAPEYSGMIQTMGWSTGGQPAVDVAIRLNGLYQDPRYAVNQVTELDAPSRWQGTRWQAQFIPPWDAYIISNECLDSSAVDGEPLRHDHYWGEAYRLFNVPRDLVGIYLEGHDHWGVPDWYRDSLTSATANEFNHGVVTGAFWSVVGPGKNLQVTTDSIGHYFHRTPEGQMVMFDENAYPGCLPEPVTLAAWLDVSDSSADGVVLSCRYSENAVSYQLLLGSDAHRVSHYEVISETPIPPQEVIRDLPAGEVWWTIRVRDQYGSSIYADPIRLDPTSLQPSSIENARTGKRYGLIKLALADAEPDDLILLGPAIYEERIEFGGTPVTIRSLDPNDPTMVAGTIITGRAGAPTVTFSGREDSGSVLAGLTIQSTTVGVSCRDAIPTIRNCIVECPDGIAVEFWHGCTPRLIDCTVLGRVREGGDPGLIAYWKLDETEGSIAHDSEGNHDGTVIGVRTWKPAGGAVDGALELNGMTSVATDFVLSPSAGPFSVFAWVKGGAPGQVIVSQQAGLDWLALHSATGALTTELKNAGRLGKALSSDAIVTDGNWHRVGVTWDGSARRLYVDNILVAEDAQAGLAEAYGGLTIGAGKNLSAGTFFTGLIDDIRIYNRAVKP